MKKITGKKGQSAVEFAVMMPVFIVTSLGLIQLGLIFINAMMLKYTAFMTARVACVYEEGGSRDSAAGKAQLILKTMQLTAGNYGNNVALNFLNGAADAAKDAAAGFLQGGQLKVEKEDFTKAKGDYIRVTVTYNMPLKVPFVNKIFGLFSNKNEWDILNAGTAAAFVGFPFYTLKATSIMRVQ